MTNNSRKKQQMVSAACAACGVGLSAAFLAGRAFAAPGAKIEAGDKGKPAVRVEVMKNGAALKPLTEDEKIIHVLNRLGFGPRPGDVEKVRAMGLERYINQQLSPESVPDTAVDQKIAAYAMLSMSSEQLGDIYSTFLTATRQAIAARKQVVKQTAQPGENMTPGAANAADAANGGETTPASTDPAAAGTVKKGKKGKKNQASPAGPQEMTPDAANAAQTAPAGDTPAPAEDAAKKGKKNLMANATPEERQAALTARQELLQASRPVAQAQAQFMDAKMLRAVESERQFQEVLVDFWSNHFNIDIRKQPCGILKIVDDRDVIRPHVLGKFRNLLEASAKSPAMLVYLDNFRSTSDTPQMNQANPLLQRRLANRRRLLAAGAGNAAPGANPNVPAAPPAKKQRGGLNENYAREIMELHTLGVDGGYTQKDVTEVARCLTGWSMSGLNTKRAGNAGKYTQAGGFRFYPALHDNGEKIVLGQRIPAGGGIQDGEKVLDMLASNPATMKHVSTQLCQRLVSDNPPASLVDKCVAVWKRTDGDLREITRTIVFSPEFMSASAYRSKIKSPFEYAVSSVRALGGTYAASDTVSGRRTAQVKPPKGGGYLNMNTTSLVGEVGTMGQPLFQYQAPTGYPEESQKWVSSGALISRMNFSLALTGGKLADVSLPNVAQTLPNTKDTGQFIDRFATQILHQRLAPSTRATLLKEAGTSSTEMASTAGENAAAPRLAALLLGSPEFQRR